MNHGHFLNAAEVLADLAEGREYVYEIRSRCLKTEVFSPSFGMKLDKRIEYLSLALGNAKSHQASEFDEGHQAPVEFLTDLDEKLEVANVQLDIYEQMKGLRHLSEAGMKDVEALGSTLLDVTAVRALIHLFVAELCSSQLQLYHRYADPYDLNDMKLLILKVSDHRDPQVVSATWRAIFENG